MPTSSLLAYALSITRSSKGVSRTISQKRTEATNDDGAKCHVPVAHKLERVAFVTCVHGRAGGPAPRRALPRPARTPVRAPPPALAPRAPRFLSDQMRRPGPSVPWFPRALRTAVDERGVVVTRAASAFAVTNTVMWFPPRFGVPCPRVSVAGVLSPLLLSPLSERGRGPPVCGPLPPGPQMSATFAHLLGHERCSGDVTRCLGFCGSRSNPQS